MMLRPLFTSATGLVLLVGLTSLAEGKTRAECLRDYTPQRAQDGKDVIWVPTPDTVVIRMLEMAKVSAADKVYDLGAGDGVIPIAAGKRFGATAVGIEYDADLAQHAQCLAEAEGVADRVEIIQGDIFAADFSDATVVTLYLLPELNLRLRPTLLALKPGTRVVSYSFTMGDWDPDDIADTDEGSAYLWIVPAKIGGTWSFRATSGPDAFDAALEQTFHKLRGSVGDDALSGTLSGAAVAFSFMQDGAIAEFAGTADGDRIHGTLTRDGRSVDYVGSRR